MSDAAIETLLAEERRYPPPDDFAAQANAQPDLYELSFEELWEREGRERVAWFEPFTELYEWELPYAKWYLGGKLNACFNCVDRHVDAGRGSKVAYYWEGEPDDDRRIVTFADLLRETTRLANALRELGVRKGTPVGDLHGHGPGAADRDARVRADRRAAHGRLRRFLGRVALGADERHGVRGADHAGRGVAARHDRPAEGDRRRGSRRGTRRPVVRGASPDGRRRFR